MVIIKERKYTTMDTISAFKKIAELFGQISLALGQLERKLTVLEFSESYLGEGTLADRNFVEDKIKELQLLLTEVEKVHPLFTQDDIRTSFEQKQTALNKALIFIPGIKANMLSVWEMRNSGVTEKDNKDIQRLIEKMFNSINIAIKEIQNCIKAHNQISARKLSFNVKWPPLK
jgi:hypothetical protein